MINYRYTKSGDEAELYPEWIGSAESLRVHYSHGNISIILRKGLFQQTVLPVGNRRGEVNHFICDRFEIKA